MAQPEAHICVKKNRVKVYSDKIYLQDKQEFEFELSNPTQTTQLAKISLNGKLISNSGIVLKPGERVYLERFIDSTNKFRFDTYTVDGDSAEVLKAIQTNGDIEVSFYPEKQVLPTYNYPGSIFINQQGTGGFDPFTFTTTSDYDGRACMDQMSFCSTEPPREKCRDFNPLRKASLEVETGRVEKGSTSNQKFGSYTGEFEWYTSRVVKYKLMPASSKPLEAKDIANYCVECGTKNRGNKFKFCPTCGTKF